MSDDPFRHHPELRGKIADPLTSYFRELDYAEIDRRLAEIGRGTGWRTPCAEREAGRRATLADRRGRDLWVFAYGSLIWDPAILFAEVRAAHAPRHARVFCLWDEGARGSPEHPGLMAALDTGTGCDGLAFRIEAARLEKETEVLWRREMIAGAYRPEFIELQTGGERIEALAFVANHDWPEIVTGLSLEAQARMIARAEGMIGRSMDYLENIAAHLDDMGLHDPHVAELRRRAREIAGAGPPG